MAVQVLDLELYEIQEEIEATRADISETAEEVGLCEFAVYAKHVSNMDELMEAMKRDLVKLGVPRELVPVCIVAGTLYGALSSAINDAAEMALAPEVEGDQ